MIMTTGLIIGESESQMDRMNALADGVMKRLIKITENAERPCLKIYPNFDNSTPNYIIYVADQENQIDSYKIGDIQSKYPKSRIVAIQHLSYSLDPEESYCECDRHWDNIGRVPLLSTQNDIMDLIDYIL